ncbi:MAG: hypothetical protein JRF02_06215 [Deltaproteobacteria bacterium]|jgi:hypothetical protein|nr:hypothetical protein [Deltaproteobacteria bacterium]
MEVYFGVAEEMDITEEELAAVRAMVMAVTAGRIFFQSKTIVERMKETGSTEETESECSPGCCE